MFDSISCELDLGDATVGLQSIPQRLAGKVGMEKLARK